MAMAPEHDRAPQRLDDAPPSAEDEPPGDERRLIAALRAGDERAFEQLIDAYRPAMLRLARLYVRDDAVAQEVVQEAWLGMLRGLDRFEGRAALKTWIFRILTNRAKTHAVREGRTVPFSALDRRDDDGAESSVSLDRFDPDSGHWVTPPSSWNEPPEEQLLAAETRDLLAAAIKAMPPNQQAVITLRDLEGWSAADVCTVLGISEANQRVLLHRARTRARRALERHLAHR